MPRRQLHLLLRVALAEASTNRARAHCFFFFLLLTLRPRPPFPPHSAAVCTAAIDQFYETLFKQLHDRKRR